MNKDILLIKTNTLLRCEMLNVPDDVEVIIQPKDEEQVLLTKPFNIK